MNAAPEPERAEVEAAFRHFWTVGNVDENWRAWPDLFTEDVHYVEHIYGEMRGRAAVLLAGARREALGPRRFVVTTLL